MRKGVRPGDACNKIGHQPYGTAGAILQGLEGGMEETSAEERHRM